MTSHRRGTGSKYLAATATFGLFQFSVAVVSLLAMEFTGPQIGLKTVKEHHQRTRTVDKTTPVRHHSDRNRTTILALRDLPVKTLEVQVSTQTAQSFTNFLNPYLGQMTRQQ